jgi:glycosyltransferase involved in cell wall biosynthesis
MVASVLRLLRDQALYEAISRTARARVEEKWKREPMVTQYENYYRRVLSSQAA